MRLKIVCGILLTLLIVGMLSPCFVAYAGKFNLGDTVEVINCTYYGKQLVVRDTPGGNPIGGRNDGDRGMILTGPQNAYYDGILYAWWKIHWQKDSLEGWSAEGYPGGVDYLKKVYLSDLTFEDIWIQPDPPSSGALTSWGFRIKNQGAGDASGTFYLECYFDNTYVGRVSVNGLLAGSTYTTYWQNMIWPSDTNPHVIKGVVDPTNTIIESDEANNIRSEVFQASTPINQPPSLNNGYVTPSSGDTTTTFSYYVTYKDHEGDIPSANYVYIDGSPYTMTITSGDYVSGALFRYSATLSAGSHNYYFYFNDGHSHTVTFPTSGTTPGPSVSAPINQPPSLNNGYVTPSSGDTTTTFSYYVTYIDPEGDVPSADYVYIDGSPYAMTKVSGDYVSGATYRYSTILAQGSYNYYFSFDDGHAHPVSLPPSGTYPGPSVSSVISPDFSISAFPTSLTIHRGSSGTSTITVASANGFSQSVQLTVPDAPSGVTLSFSPPQVTPPSGNTAQSTLTLYVSSSTIINSYQLTVTGISGSLTRIANINLQVTSEENRPPTLSDGGVAPSSGVTTTLFEYSVIYADLDTDAPTVSQVYIDGSPHAMTQILGNYLSGATYRYSTTLAQGSHNYYFYFDDGHTHTARLPSSGTSSGPTVSSTPVAGFTIVPSPTSLTIEPGKSGSLTITIYSINGFNQPVQLSITQPPPGVTTSFNPSQVTPPSGGSAKSTLTFSVSTTATPGGPFALTLTGTSGSILRSTNIQLQIQSQPPDFSIMPSPTTLTMQRGGMDMFTITVTSMNGFNRPVRLETSGTAPGIAATFYPVYVTPPSGGSASSTLLVSVAKTATPGMTYQLTVTGTSEIGTHSKSIYLQIGYLNAEAGPDRSVSSGDRVTFDGTNSNPFDTIRKFQWDFKTGEGEDEVTIETKEGSQVEYRFRGAMNGPKLYTVVLTVEDNQGSKATDTVSVTVKPLTKVVDVGGSLFGWVSCWMSATYNWVGTDQATGEDLYVVSKIGSYCGGMVGSYQLFIMRRVSPPPSIPKLIWHVPLLGAPIESSYSAPFTPSWWQRVYGTPCDSVRLTFPDGLFEGIEVTKTSNMVIVATGTATGITVYYDVGVTQFDPNYPISHLKMDEFKKIYDFKEIIDLIRKLFQILVSIGSPGELRVYDSNERMTGLVDGIVKEDIPGAMYVNGTVIILYPSGSYRYEVAGTREGEYGLEIASVNETGSISFTATAIPISSSVVHGYTIDWNLLSKGQEGVIVRVDSDGNGVPEQALSSDSTLTSAEFLAGQRLAADLNGNSKVDLGDLVILAQAYGSKMGDPKWNPIADINGDGKIGLVDLTIIAINYPA
jgi:hypothetical protein